LEEVVRMSELLGRRLRALRRLKRLTQQELAVEIGISVSLLSSIERGGKYPRLELLKKISRSLDVPLEDLFVLPGTFSEHS
jgi:transcriptional regulator with XRE-family HTH domain